MTAPEPERELGHWLIIHRARPVSLNDYRKRHWREATEHEKEWRTAAWGLCKQAKIPALERVRFECVPFGPRSRQDPGNCYPSVKAMIDGVVDAGVIPDDTGEHVASITLFPWRPNPAPALQLHIYEVTDGS